MHCRQSFHFIRAQCPVLTLGLSTPRITELLALPRGNDQIHRHSMAAGHRGRYPEVPEAAFDSRPRSMRTVMPWVHFPSVLPINNGRSRPLHDNRAIITGHYSHGSLDLPYLTRWRCVDLTLIRGQTCTLGSATQRKRRAPIPKC